MAVHPAPRFITPGDYLTRERASDTRHEYVNGVIYAMAGASRAHILITGNSLIALSRRLEGTPCETYSNDMRVKVEASGMYTYPDLVVSCDPDFEDNTVDTLLNPLVIFEVLSPSTEDYDRGAKFAHYQRLPSLREYVLIWQDRARVDKFTHPRDGGDEWLQTLIVGLGSALTLDSLNGATIPLTELYNRVAFPTGDGIPERWPTP